MIYIYHPALENLIHIYILRDKLINMSGSSGSSFISSPFIGGSVLLNVALPPSALGRGDAAASQALAEVCMKYHASLGGFLVAFSGARFSASGRHALCESSGDGSGGGGAGVSRGEPLGRIAGEQPVISTRVSAQVLLFSPKIGTVLRGTVSHVGDGHIGALVAGLFNATVLASDMIGGYAWCDTGAGPAAWQGTDVWIRATTHAAAAIADADDTTTATATSGTGKKRRRSDAGVSAAAAAAAHRVLALNPSTIGIGDVIVFKVRGMSHGGGVFVIHGSF